MLPLAATSVVVETAAVVLLWLRCDAHNLTLQRARTELAENGGQWGSNSTDGNPQECRDSE